MSFIETLLQVAHHTSARVQPRSAEKVYLHTLSEIGELGEEANIAAGELYKSPGVDGVTGEAADVINCLSDLLYVCAPPLADLVPVRRVISDLAAINDFDAAEAWPSMLEARSRFVRATRSIVDLQGMLSNKRGSLMPAAHFAVADLVRASLILAKADRPVLTQRDFLAIYHAKCAKWLEKAG